MRRENDAISMLSLTVFISFADENLRSKTFLDDFLSSWMCVNIDLDINSNNNCYIPFNITNEGT